MAVTTAAVVGMAATAATTGMSFAQAAKQNKLQKEAQRDAEKAMAEARKKLEVNYYDQLSIQKEPYELQREALLSAGAQAIQAGVESERGAAATAGRVQMGMNEAQAQIRSAEGQEMSALEKLSAQESSRLRDVGVNLDLEEAAGAQLAARDAAEAKAQAISQGMAGVTSLGQQVATQIPLYAKSQGAKQLSSLQQDYQSMAAKPDTLNPIFKDASGKPLPFQEAMAVMGQQKDFGFSTTGTNAYDALKFQDYYSSQDPKFLSAMRAYGFGIQPTK